MGNVARFKRIYIEITSSCNLKCSFCQETLRSPHFMSVDEFAHTLQQIRPYTNYIYLHVKGEPLLHPQLDEILALCRRAGVTVNLTTNGTLLAQKLPILLAQTDTEISLRLWNTTGVPTLFGEKNCVIKRHLYVNVQSPFEWPALDNAYCNDRGFCQGLRQHMAVLSDGTVVPCCLDGNAVMALGNIFTTPLKDILAGERSVRFIEGFRAKRAVEPLCRHCSFKERFSHKM